MFDEIKWRRGVCKALNNIGHLLDDTLLFSQVIISVVNPTTVGS
jgi:hypothetical protein